MGLEIQKQGDYTRVKYFGYGKDIQWYIKERGAFPGVLRCVEGELVLNLPNRPNLLQLFPQGGFLERTSQEFRVVQDQKTIDDILRKFSKTDLN